MTKIPSSGHIQVHKPTMARLVSLIDDIRAGGAIPAECTQNAVVMAALVALEEKRNAQKRHDEVYGKPGETAEQLIAETL